MNFTVIKTAGGGALLAFWKLLTGKFDRKNLGRPTYTGSTANNLTPPGRAASHNSDNPTRLFIVPSDPLPSRHVPCNFSFLLACLFLYFLSSLSFPTRILLFLPQLSSLSFLVSFMRVSFSRLSLDRPHSNFVYTRNGRFHG